MYYWLTVFSPRVVTFSFGSSRPIGNIRIHRMRVETIFGGLPCRRSLTSRVSLASARSLFHLLLPSACYAGHSNLVKCSVCAAAVTIKNRQSFKYLTLLSKTKLYYNSLFPFTTFTNDIYCSKISSASKSRNPGLLVKDTFPSFI